MFVTIFFVITFLWLIGMTLFVLRMFQHYNSLTQNTHQKTLMSILETVLKENAMVKKDIENVMKRCDTIEHDALLHIQKIGLLRFNPFKDTGGNQSFILALIDGNDTGIVISGLYSRSGTRWYAKKLIEGKPVDHELSDEEKKAIQMAKESK